MEVVIPSQFLCGLAAGLGEEGGGTGWLVGLANAIGGEKYVRQRRVMMNNDEDHTVRRIADEIAPSTLGAFRKPDLDLYFADSKLASVRVDLALERFQY